MDTSLLFDVFTLNQTVARLLGEAMRDGPLVPAEYAVYSAIFELEAATPTALAARLGLRLTTFIDRLRAIEDRGHARRLAHPGDRRSYRVVLTSDGLAAHRAANALFERAHAAFEVELRDSGADAKRAFEAVRAAADRARTRLATEARVATPRSSGRAG